MSKILKILKTLRAHPMTPVLGITAIVNICSSVDAVLSKEKLIGWWVTVLAEVPSVLGHSRGRSVSAHALSTRHSFSTHADRETIELPSW